jgi:uncharacterized protein YceH (UPF0502 family)
VDTTDEAEAVSRSASMPPEADDRVEALEREVGALRAEVAALRAQLDAFRRQFE